MKEKKSHTPQPSPALYWIIAGAIALLLFFALRFWNLGDRVIFDWDQESYARQMRAIVREGDFSLLGPRTTHDKGFFLAPYFTYLFLPFYLAANMHPFGSILFLITYNIAFPVAAFLLLRKVFDYRYGIAFLFLWAVNSVMATYDIIPWWPILVPLGELVVLWLLHRIQNGGRLLDWALLGVVLGFFVNMHFQFVFAILFAGAYVLSDFFFTKRFALKGIVAALGGFLVMFAPLIIFDLRHDFMNAKLFWGFFFGETAGEREKLLFEWVPVLTNFLQPLTIVKNDIVTGVLYGAVTAIAAHGIIVTEGFRKRFYTAATVLLVSTPLFFMAYGQRPSEYYFVYLYPIICIAIIDATMRLGNRLAPVALIGLAGVLALLNYPVFAELMRPEPFGLAAKQKTAEYLDKNIAGKNYIVSFDVEPGREPGFRYLLEHYGIRPHNGTMTDLPLVEIRIPPRDGDVKVTDDIGLRIPEQLNGN
jgi:hypothetical protein